MPLDTATDIQPRTAREEKRRRVWAHLERHCRGKARRMITKDIMGAVGLDKRELAAAISDLRRLDRKNIATDDAGDEVGVWLPEGPEGAEELDRAIYRMHRRIDGETETVNAMMASRFRDFPPEQFPVKPELRHVGQALHRRGAYKRLSEERLPDGYERDLNAQRSRATKAGPVERSMLSESVERSSRAPGVYRKSRRRHVPTPPAELFDYACPKCGWMIEQTTVRPETIPTCRECRARGETVAMKRLAATVVV